MKAIVQDGYGAPQQAKDGNAVIEACGAVLRDAIPFMVKLEIREARRGKFYLGDALDWSRLDFDARRSAMLESLHSSLLEREAASATTVRSRFIWLTRWY